MCFVDEIADAGEGLSMDQFLVCEIYVRQSGD